MSAYRFWKHAVFLASSDERILIIVDSYLVNDSQMMLVGFVGSIRYSKHWLGLIIE